MVGQSWCVHYQMYYGFKKLQLCTCGTIAWPNTKEIQGRHLSLLLYVESFVTFVFHALFYCGLEGLVSFWEHSGEDTVGVSVAVTPIINGKWRTRIISLYIALAYLWNGWVLCRSIFGAKKNVYFSHDEAQEPQSINTVSGWGQSGASGGVCNH